MKGTRLKDILTEFERLFKQGVFNVANNMIAKAYLNVPNLSTDKLLTYIKAAYPEREKLAAYPYFFKSVRAELEKRGEDLDRLKEFV